MQVFAREDRPEFSDQEGINDSIAERDSRLHELL